MKRRRSSPPASARSVQLTMPLSSAAGAGTGSGGIERDTGPTTPPTIVAVASVAAELRYGPLDPPESVNQSTATLTPLLDDAAAAASARSSAELPRASGKAVNDAEVLVDASVAEKCDPVPVDSGDAGVVPEHPITALQLVDSGSAAQLAQLADLALNLAAGAQTPAEALLSQLGPGSRKAMRLALDRIARLASGGIYNRNTFPWGRLRYPHALWIRNQLAQTDAPKYVNKCLAAFRGVLREAFIMGLFGPDGAEEYAKAIRIKNVKGTRRRRPRRLALDEWRAMFAVCDDSPRGRRDAAFLAIMRQGGARCWEAAGVDLGDYEADTGRLFIARAKNDKQGTVYITHEGTEAIARWLEVRGPAPGPLLCPVNKAGRVVLARVSPGALGRWWQRLRAAANLPPSWPHCARASFITDVAERRGVDVAQKLARHARLDQTGEYLVLDEERLRQASEDLVVPIKR